MIVYNFILNNLPYILRFICGVTSFVFVSFIIKYYFATKRYKDFTNKISDNIRKMNTVKKEEFEMSKKLEGESVKISYIDKINDQINYSGMDLNKIKWLNGISFIIIQIFCMAMGLVVSIYLRNNIFITGIIVVSIFAITRIPLKIMCDIQNNKIKKNFIFFARIVYNFSKSDADLLTILENSAYYIENPLKNKILSTISMARANGDISGAFRKLIASVEYRYFKDLIRNLEITSKNSLNYSEIIEQFISNTEKFNGYMAKQKIILKKSVLGIVVMLAMGFAMFYLAAVVMLDAESLIQGIQIFINNIFGRIIIWYLAFVLVFSFWYIAFKAKSDQ